MKTILIMLLLISSTCFAATGNELLSKCSPSATDINMGFCYGYMDGLTDGAAGVGLFCLPSGVTLGQLKSVFLKHAYENPSNLHMDAAGVAGYAFALTFPCKTKPNRQSW